MRRTLAIIFSIVIIVAVGVTIYFTVPDIFGSVVAPLPDQYREVVQKHARTYGIDSCFVAAIIRGESNWNPNARSRAGASGLGQLMPGTARGIAARYNVAYSPSQILDPNKNVELMTALWHYNFSTYGSTRNALVAYNAGGARVKLSDDQLPRETKAYIPKMNNYYNLYKQLYPDFCTGMTLKVNISTTQSSGTNFPDFPPVPAEEPDIIKLDKLHELLLKYEN